MNYFISGRGQEEETIWGVKVDKKKTEMFTDA